VTEQPAASTATWLRTLAAIGSPVAIGTALLYYFGWVRTRFQVRTIGYDPSVLGLSVQDYLLRSINVLFLPLVVLLLGFLILHLQHRRLIAAARRDPRTHRRLVRVGRLLTITWPCWLLVIVVLLAIPATEFVAIPVGLTAGAALALYGNMLVRELQPGRQWPATTAVLACVLLALAVFWDTERVARMTGEAFAADILAFPQQLVAVTVYSERRLEIHAPGTVEERLDPKAAYAFRYTGLRLLESNGDRYILMNEDGGRVLVLREGDGIRFEFSG
jgi:hypothetical protein